MTTKELIEKLQTFPPDMPVLVEGYEGGLKDVEKLEVSPVFFNVNESWYYGPHDETSYWHEGDPGTPPSASPCLILRRS